MKNPDSKLKIRKNEKVLKKLFSTRDGNEDKEEIEDEEKKKRFYDYSDLKINFKVKDENEKNFGLKMSYVNQ